MTADELLARLEEIRDDRAFEHDCESSSVRLRNMISRLIVEWQAARTPGPATEESQAAAKAWNTWKDNHGNSPMFPLEPFFAGFVAGWEARPPGPATARLLECLACIAGHPDEQMDAVGASDFRTWARNAIAEHEAATKWP